MIPWVSNLSDSNRLRRAIGVGNPAANQAGDAGDGEDDDDSHDDDDTFANCDVNCNPSSHTEGDKKA